MNSLMNRIIRFYGLLLIVCDSLGSGTQMPDMEECLVSGLETRNLEPIIVLAMVLQCVFLQWDSYITILRLLGS